MRSTSTGATPFDAASRPVRFTYLEDSSRWSGPGALLAQRYELEERQDAGAPGHFWRAHQLRTRRLVTVQLLDPAIVEDAVLMEAFLQEASLAAAIDHPHVARVLDYGIDYELQGGVPFLVLAHLTGETLERRLQQRSRLSLPEVARVLSHTASGLEALHERGIVHRRLDPSHVLLSEEFPSGSFRAGTFTRGSSFGAAGEFPTGGPGLELEGGATTLLLFALEEAFRESLCLVHQLSHQLGSGSAINASSVVKGSVVNSSVVNGSVVNGSVANSAAGAGAVVARSVGRGGSGVEPAAQPGKRPRAGTGSYQSPEQLLGQGAVDARSDLWSLAVIAFEALTGTTAFAGATLGERLVRVCNGEPSAVPADVALPAGFSAWFQRGVRKLPSERFGSAREMSEAFARLLDG